MSFSDLNIKDTSTNKGKIPSSHSGIMPFIKASKIQTIPEMADILVQRPAMVRTGVFPRHAQVRAILGTRRNPDSSRNTKWAPSPSAFFYMGPHRTFPVTNGRLVPLPRPFGRFLATPAKRVHHPPKVSDAITHAETLLDHSPDPF